MGHRRWVLAFPVLALALASCAAPSSERTASPEPAPPATSPAQPSNPSPRPTDEPTEDPPPQVPLELRFTAPALGGGTIEGADHAGQDLVIWFWAPW